MFRKFILLTSLAFSALLLLGGTYLGTVHAATAYVVTKTSDTADGVCNSDCSLREAITAANANSGADTITFNIPNMAGCTAANHCTITLGSTLPAINDTLTINGSASIAAITISGNNAVRALAVNSGKTLNLNALTIANANYSGSGGGIYNLGTLNVTNSTFSNNSAISGGGGIFSDSGTLNVTNSTFSGNSANYGGGISNYGGTTTLKNTIVANSTSGGDCYTNSGTLTADSRNLDSDGSCGNATQKTTFEIKLGALANHGGPTQTMGLGTGSAAIDTGDDAVCGAAPVNGYDQRGVLRPQGAHCDVGAHERESAVSGSSFIVTVAADSNDGVCGAVYCTLREAITAANAHSGADTITFNIPRVGGCTTANVCTITLGSQLPDINDTLTINGSANNAAITLSGNHAVRVMRISSNKTLNLNALAIVNGTNGILNYRGTLNVTNSTFSGNSATGGGGAIFSDWGTLNVTNSTFSGNSAINGGGGIYILRGTLNVTNSTFSGNSAPDGGAIYKDDGTLNLTNSTFSANSATDDGGGIYNNDLNPDSTATVTNSTFSGNSATDGGGGIFNYTQSNIPPSIINSTFSGNSAAGGGGIYNLLGSITLKNSIVANSAAGGDCYPGLGSITADSYNLDSDGSCGNATQKTTAQINLQPLADNGGPTQTMALGSGSAAIDTADDAVCAAAPVSGKDQRGVTRPQGAHCDVGAYEAPAVPPTATSTPTTMSQTNTPTATPTNTPTNALTATPTNAPTATPTTPNGCNAKPAKPTLTAPSNGAAVSKAKVNLKWNDVTCETKYKVRVKDAATNARVFKKNLGGNVTQVKTSALPQDKTYKWFVKACNSFGCARSAVQSFER